MAIMFRIHNRLTAAGILALLGGPASVLTAQVRADDLVDTLRDHDRRVATGDLKAAFELRVPANPRDPAQGLEIRTCVFTRAGATVGMVQTSRYDKSPVYRSEGVGGYESIDYDDGSLVVWRTIEKYSVQSPEKNASFRELVRVQIARDGSIVDDGMQSRLERYPVHSKDNLHEWDDVVLAAGRGLGDKIAEITEANTRPDGLLRVGAVGTYGGFRGRWTLLIDPAADHLVRYGRFVADGDAAPLLMIRSAGIVRGPGGRSLAAGGTFTHLLGRQQNYENAVTIRTLSDEADRAALGRIEQRVSETALRRGAQVLDFRLEPAVRVVVGE